MDPGLPVSAPVAETPGTEPLWLDEHQQRCWRALVLGSTLLLGRLDDELQRDHGLSMTEYEILVRLSESDGRMRMARLADALAHSRSRVTHTVKRLEDAGLVRREDTPHDGRGVDAVLTGPGMALLVSTAPTHVAGVRRHLIEHASPEDLSALGRVMDAVADSLIDAHPEMELRERR